ncbi:hypothetical protein COOONC_02738 [Cooperia oncophora]
MAQELGVESKAMPGSATMGSASSNATKPLPAAASNATAPAMASNASAPAAPPGAASNGTAPSATSNGTASAPASNATAPASTPRANGTATVMTPGATSNATAPASSNGTAPAPASNATAPTSTPRANGTATVMTPGATSNATAPAGTPAAFSENTRLNCDQGKLPTHNFPSFLLKRTRKSNTDGISLSHTFSTVESYNHRSPRNSTYAITMLTFTERKLSSCCSEVIPMCNLNECNGSVFTRVMLANHHLRPGSMPLLAR